MTTDSQGGTEGGYPLPSARRSVLKPLVRTAVGLAIITLLVVRSDLGALAEAISGADPAMVGLAFALLLGLVVVSALRWEVFLASLDVELAPGPTLRLTFVGAFFNAFLPTGVGGDAYKAMRVRGPGVPLSKTLASVLVDRIVGIVCLAAFSLVAAVPLLGEPGPVVAVAGVVALGILAAAGLLIALGPRFFRTVRGSWFGVRPRLERTAQAIREASTHPRSVRAGVMWGLVTQVLGIGAHVALARSLDIEIGVAAMTLGVLIATVAATAPITINGLGVREGAWAWILGAYGVGEIRALAFALLVLAMSLATSVVGGIVYAAAGGEVAATTTRARS